MTSIETVIRFESLDELLRRSEDITKLQSSTHPYLKIKIEVNAKDRLPEFNHNAFHTTDVDDKLVSEISAELAKKSRLIHSDLEGQNRQGDQ